ncbi:MAG: hypothetical protein QM759_00405 [Terricaulis sp.]
MTLDSNEAKRALADIQSAAEKSSALRGYATAGNYLIVWGFAWIAGGAAGFVSPGLGRTGWSVAVIVAIAASIVLGLRTPAAPGSRNTLGKIIAMIAVMAGISVALTVVLDATMRQAFALQALIVAGLYMGYGIWRGLRIFALGFALAAAVLLGWFYFRDQVEAFVGIAGGVMLIVSGIWLRRA